MNDYIEKVLCKAEKFLDEKQFAMLKSVMKLVSEEENKSSHKKNSELLNDFLDSKSYEDCSPATIQMYRYENERFIQRINKPVTEVNKKDIEHYLFEYRNERNVSNVTINNMRRYISAFFTYLEYEDIIQCNPVRKTKPVKEVKTVKKPFTDLEIEEMKENASDLRDRAIIDTLNTTGLRVSELCSLNIGDIQNNSAIIQGKGKKERTVYFSETAIHSIKKYIAARHDDNPALFVNNRKTNETIERISKSTVESIIRNIGKSINIKAHPHKFRRTVASRAANKGMPIQEIQVLLGHAKLDTTMNYCNVSEKNVRISHEKYI